MLPWLRLAPADEIGFVYLETNYLGTNFFSQKYFLELCINSFNQ
jgi:hypothetical protein